MISEAIFQSSPTRSPWPHFRRYSFDITACRQAVTEQLAARAAGEGKGAYWKQKPPIELETRTMDIT
jgi:hypothetical protein